MFDSGFEEKMDFAIKLKSSDIAKGMEMAIEVEKKGKKFYEEKKENIKNDDVKHLFEFLGSEEDMHINLLEELKESLQKKGKWTEIGEIEHKDKPEVFEDGKEPSMKDNVDIHVILAAMRAEKYLEKFYKVLAGKSKEGKEFFEKMAVFERNHFELLDNILDSLTYNRVES